MFRTCKVAEVNSIQNSEGPTRGHVDKCQFLLTPATEGCDLRCSSGILRLRYKFLGLSGPKPIRRTM
jgi:hypothetical protein